jgi:hypothetical protein
MLARMFERRLKGYDAIGYVIERETVPPHTRSLSEKHSRKAGEMV